MTSSSSLSCPARYSSSSLGIVSNGLPLPNSAPWIRFSNSVSSNDGIWMVFLPGPASPVITTVPRLRTAANADATTSSVTTPTVISA